MMGTGLMTPRQFNIYKKPFSWKRKKKTKHKNKKKLALNAEIIAGTKDIKHVYNFHLFRKVFHG